MSALAIALLIGAVATLGAVLIAVLRRREEPELIQRAERILFPFYGTTLPQSALDAALRLCRAEEASLVPAFLAQVPMTLNIDAPLPRQAEQAMPMLEAIEQRGVRSGVPVDSRIERGRTHRHAMRELISHEHYDRIVTSAATTPTDAFSAEDIAWLLENVPGEIVILRPAERGPGVPSALASD